MKPVFEIHEKDRIIKLYANGESTGLEPEAIIINRLPTLFIEAIAMDEERLR